jgi:serine/threonine-protein kinase RsbW
MTRTSVELTLQFLRKLDYLRLTTAISRLVCETVKPADVQEGFVNEVELAVSEACTNAIQHADCTDGHGTVVISFQVYDNRLIIEVKDQGAGFNMEDIPAPEFDEHPESGYGLYIIRSVMDEVQYIRGQSFNTLTMKKYFTKAP